MTPRLRTAVLALACGSLLAVGAPVAWLVGQQPDQYGAGAAAALAAPPAAGQAGRGSAADGVSPPPVSGPADQVRFADQVGTQPAGLDDLAVRDVPVGLRLAGRDVPVDAVGVDDAGRVVIPEDVRRAGWYAPGPAPGAPTGAAVLVGHVDDRRQGLGAFAVLRDLEAGAVVQVRTAAGRSLSYEVVALEQFAKPEVPMERLFTVTGAHRLVLISCAGEFDEERGSYQDNVVVTAVPRR